MAIQGRYVELLDGSGIDRDEAGGKAWALDRLVELGFRVPPALVVRASAYRRFAASGPVAAFLDELRARPLPAASETAAAEAAVEQAFLAQAIPGDVVDEVAGSAAPLVARGRIAVRSSATAEDMAEQSFAGQYRTFLGVDAMIGVFDAVRRCWASLWFPGARLYRRHAEIGDDDLAMAVILQHQVPADWSGVLFSRDPQGDGSTLRVESVAGLGDDLVSGRLTPSDFVIDRRSLAVLAGRHDPPPFLEDVARLGLRIERRMGEPQDVEWSIAGGKLWVLQSRPITVGAPLAVDDDGFDTDPLPEDTFTPEGIGEMLPGVLSPLIWSINRPMVDAAFRRMLARLGAVVGGCDRSMVGRFRGRAALNLGALREAVASLPSGDADDVDAAYLGPSHAAVEPATPAQGDRASMRMLIRNWRAQRRVEDEVQVLCTAVSCLEVIEPELAGLPLDKLLAYRSELRDLAWRGTAAEVAASAAAGSAYRSLEVLLSKWLGEVPGSAAAQRVTSGTLRRAMVGPCRLSRLAEVIERVRMPSLWRMLDDGRPETIRRRLVDAGGSALVDAVEDAAWSFGSISVYAGPTFAEDEERLWQLAIAARTLPPQGDEPGKAIAELIDALAADRRWKLLRILSGQFIDLRRKLLLRMTADTVRYLTLREQAKGALLTVGGMERRVIVEGARRLHRSGLLARPADVELLSDAEFEEMLRGGEPVSRLEMHRRSAARQAALHGDPLPASFTGSPTGAVGEIGEGPVVSGWAASAGVVRGPVRRVRDLSDGDALVSGEILVATATDPSWTPLFLRAGGIVLERGGPLSHAAIVAREIGIPAVLNVPHAMARFADGAVIEVDGSNGLVRVMTDSPVGTGAAR